MTELTTAAGTPPGADALIAITYGTPGTADMIKRMRSVRKPIFVMDLRATGSQGQRLAPQRQQVQAGMN